MLIQAAPLPIDAVQEGSLAAATVPTQALAARGDLSSSSQRQDAVIQLQRRGWKSKLNSLFSGKAAPYTAFPQPGASSSSHQRQVSDHSDSVSQASESTHSSSRSADWFNSADFQEQEREAVFRQQQLKEWETVALEAYKAKTARDVAYHALQQAQVQATMAHDQETWQTAQHAIKAAEQEVETAEHVFKVAQDEKVAVWQIVFGDRSSP